MSDVDLGITWAHLAIVAPALGWPGAIPGALIGAFAWRRRRIWGALAGAFLGAAAVGAYRIAVM